MVMIEAPASRHPAVVGAVAGRPLVAPLLERLLGERLFDWLRAIRRVRRDFALVHGHPPALLRPRRYTEKMQWRKLFDLDPRHALLSDKLAARAVVEARIGPGRMAPLLWSGADPEAIPFESLEVPFVVKSSHGSGQVLIVTDRDGFDAAEARRIARGWLGHCHGTAMREPGYVHVPRRILVERLLLGRDGARPVEHCGFVFGGRLHVFQSRVTTAAEGLRSAGFRTPGWQPLGWRFERPPVAAALGRPARLAEMIGLAERLGAGLGHVRVDFYEVDGALFVGELTLYSWSGLLRFVPGSADEELGRQWRLRRPALMALRAVAFGRHEIRPPLG